MFARKDENKRKEARNGPPRVVVQVYPIFTNPLASFTQAFDVNLFCTLKIAIKTFHANFWQLPPLINSCRYTFLLKPFSVKMYFLKFVPSESLFDLVFILNPYGAVIGRGLPVVLNGPVAATWSTDGPWLSFAEHWFKHPISESEAIKQIHQVQRMEKEQAWKYSIPFEAKVRHSKLTFLTLYAVAVPAQMMI